MSDWDYGLQDQAALEYEEAVLNGYCHGCAVRYPDEHGELCFKCAEFQNIVD